MLGFYAPTVKGVTTDIGFEFVNGLIVVEAIIDGESGHYILDTGADAIILNDRSCIGERTEFASLTGNLESYKIKVSEMMVGNLKVEQVDAFTTDLSALESFAQRKIHGILGGSIFASHTIEIDFYRKTLKISDHYTEVYAKAGRTSLSFDSNYGIPIAKIQVGDKQYSFILDTGATCHFISKEVVKANPSLFHRTGQAVNLLTAHQEGESNYKYFLKELKVDTGVLKNQIFCELDIKGLEIEASINIDGILSMSSLGVSKMVLDLNQKVVYF